MDALYWLPSNVRPSVIIRNVLVSRKGHVTCSQPTPKQFALIFDDVFITTKSGMHAM